MLKNLIIINKALKATVRKFNNCNINKFFWYGVFHRKFGNFGKLVNLRRFVAK